MNAIDTLRTWGELGRSHGTFRPKQRADWAAVNGLIKAAKPRLIADGRELRDLLEESRRMLHPFGNPFDLDLGVHRWLAEDREEAYSDWLQWIVEQVRSPTLVYQMFNLKTPADIASWRVSPTVERERFVPTGHVGCAGRLDLVIRYSGHGLIVVEVKKGGAEQADTMKQEGYAKWVLHQPEPDKHSVLVVTESEADSYNYFNPLPWGHICVFLRRLAGREDRVLKHTVIALMLAFVGAVEQNLLGMKSAHIRRVASGESRLFNPQIVDHLRTAVGSGP